MKKKFLAVLLSLAMLSGFAPGIPVLAADETEGDTGTGETVGNGDLEGDLDGDDADEEEGDEVDCCYVMIQLIDVDTGEFIFVENNPIQVGIDGEYETFSTGETGSAVFEVPLGKTIDIPANFVEGYCLVGYTTEIEPLGTVLDENNAEFTLNEGEVVIYALFEESKDVTVTFHWSSEEGTDLQEHIKVTVPSGVDLETAIRKAGDFTTNGEGEYLIFQNADKSYTQHMLLKQPVTSYGSYSEIWNAEGTPNTFWYGDLIREDLNVYVAMLKPINTVSIVTSIPTAFAATESPVITLPGNASYVLEDAEWYTEEIEKLTAETFKTNTVYVSNVFLSAKPGYYFADYDELLLTTDPSSGWLQYTGKYSVNVHIYCDSVYPQIYECLDGNKQSITQGATSPAVFRFDYSGAAAGTVGKDGLYARATSALVTNGSGTIRDELYREQDSLKLAIPSERTEVLGMRIPDGSRRILVVAGLLEGSLIVNVYPEYIDTLIPGDYTLTVFFDDGSSVSSTFTVVAAAAATATPTPAPTSAPASDATKAGSSVPSTGEGISNTIIWGAVLVSIAVISAGIVLEKKRPGKKDVK